MSEIESKIREDLREQDEIDPISRLEAIKKELERQLAAEKLLRHILGEKEYKDFIDKGSIEVESKKYPNRTYIIRELGLIEVVEDNKIIEKLCINTEHNFPLQDQLVTKKLGLEGAEELILKTANHMIPQEFRLLERTAKSTELYLKNLFSENKEEFINSIKEPKKFDIKNLFSDKEDKKEFMKRIKESSRFDIQNLFAEK